LRVTAEAASEAECIAAIEPTLATIRQALGELVFGEEDDELEDAVVRLLAEHGGTLATAEGASGGLLASWLARAARAGGSSYLGGLVLGAAPLRGAHGADDPSATDDLTSPAAAERLASKVRAEFGADYGLGIGQFPEAPADVAEPPRFYIALAKPAGVIHHTFTRAGHPAIWQPRAAKQTLNLLRLTLARRRLEA